MNVWGIECLVKSSLKSTVNKTAESFKSGIPKNDRKIDITSDCFGPLRRALLSEGDRSLEWRLVSFVISKQL